MLGAAHAAANPLTAHYDVVHGRAVLTMLPSIMKWNSQVVGEVYQRLQPDLIAWVESLRGHAGLEPVTVSESEIPQLAQKASRQWTGQFNPRPLEVEDFEKVYREALLLA